MKLKINKEVIERATLWVLAFGVFVAVSLNIAKFAVRDFRELLHEIHQSSERQNRAQNSVAAEPMAVIDCWPVEEEREMVCSTLSAAPAVYGMLPAASVPPAETADTHRTCGSAARVSR